MRTKKRQGHPTVKCWRCPLRFPENFNQQKVGGVTYVDRFANVRNHWIEKHARFSEKASS